MIRRRLKGVNGGIEGGERAILENFVLYSAPEQSNELGLVLTKSQHSVPNEHSQAGIVGIEKPGPMLEFSPGGQYLIFSF